MLVDPIERRLARTVRGSVSYVASMDEKPCYFDVDHSRDRVETDSRRVVISDAREWAEQPELEREGFALLNHRSAVPDFRNYGRHVHSHRLESEALLQAMSGADQVLLTTPAGFRFSRRFPSASSAKSVSPAHLVHVDFSHEAARHRAEQLAPGGLGKVRRFAHYNLWRVVSPPPQDVALALCDARSVDRRDLVPIDVISDTRASPEWSFEGFAVRYNPAHRWVYWSNMAIDEALIFKTYDSDPDRPQCVPHCAFEDPSCPADAPPRVSVEIRGVALWYS